MFGDQAVDPTERMRKLDSLENSQLSSLADSSRDGDVIPFPAEDQNCGAIKSRRIECAGRMRKVVIHGDDFCLTIQ